MPKKEYLCPHQKCMTLLNPGTKVILLARNSERRQGLILLSPQEGNYSVIMEEGFLRDGERVDLRCPSCGRSLEYEKDKAFANVLQKCGDIVTLIVFSRIKGEHATFKIHPDGKVVNYGTHSDFIDIPEMTDFASFRGPKNTLGA